MDNAEQVRKFALLFAGCSHAYGGDEGYAVHNQVTYDTYRRHLEGVEPIGIYPCIQLPDPRLAPSSDGLYVRWGCCDIDTGDWQETWALWNALNAMGIPAHVERSRSKGWHVWVFSQGWVPAATMRRALKVAYKAIELPAKEANPKSEYLRPGQLGNYVRLPYKGGGLVPSRTQERQTFVVGFSAYDDGRPTSFTDFMADGGPATVSQETLAYWAAKWYEPPRPDLGISVDDVLKDEQLQPLVNRLSPSLRRLWESGPKNEHKRSEGLVALAHQTARAGFGPQEVYSLVSSADRIWGKYSGRNNGQNYLLDIVERAFK